MGECSLAFFGGDAMNKDGVPARSQYRDRNGNSRWDAPFTDVKLRTDCLLQCRPYLQCKSVD